MIPQGRVGLLFILNEKEKEKIMFLKRILVMLTMTLTMHVFAQTIPPVLKNFRILYNQPSRVYFDSSVPITASTTTGFTVSGKSLSSVTIASGSTTGHYFTVSSPFTYWDNNTIRCTGGSNMKNSGGVGVSEFTMTYIKNMITEPTGAGKIYYVSLTGNNSNDGLSEAKAWRTINKAASTAKAGDIVYIKSGNYGSENVVIYNSGTVSAPIKFIGYKYKIGDLNNIIYYKYGDGILDGAKAPLMRGSSRSSGVGLLVSGKSNVIFRNIQIENYKYNIQGFSSPYNLLFDNMVLAKSGEHNVMLTHIGGHHLRFTNTLSFNGINSAIMLAGDFNAILNSKTYANEPETTTAMDYHIYLYGKNNIIYNHYGQHVGNLSHAGHGISLKSGGFPTEYNLIENCEMNNINGALEFRHSGVKYNVAKNFRSDGGKGSIQSGGIVFRDGASFNIVENSTVKNTTAGYYGSITFLDRSEDGGFGQRVEGNIVRNSVFINPKETFIMLGETTSSSEKFDIVNNKIQNCVFYSGKNLFTRLTSGTSSGNELVNCIISNVLAENKNTSASGFLREYNNYYAGFTKPAGTNNISVDPKFESPSVGNFRLKSDSPMIDKGKIINGIKTDFDGKARPQGKSLDIGAYEYQNITTAAKSTDENKLATVCEGYSTVLEASEGTSYKWSTGETTKSISVSPIETTTYTVKVLNGKSSTDTEFLVTVNEIPIADAGRDVNIDAGEMATLTANGGNEYVWSTGETSQSITVKPEHTTEYYVKVMNNGCESFDYVQVIVNEGTSASTKEVNADAGSDITICLGESITLNGSGGDTYKWSNGISSDQTMVSPTRTTTYTLTAKRGGSQDTDEVTVTVINCSPENIAGNHVNSFDLSEEARAKKDQPNDKSNLELTVFPNPTVGEIHIQSSRPLQNFKLVLTNINGHIIYSETMGALDTDQSKQIDLSRFAKGVYLMQLYNQEEHFVKKIILI